jgi:hypothetical protein
MKSGLLEAYVNDPDVKFILTERIPDKWVTSINNAAGAMVDMPYQFPFSILKYFDATLYRFLSMNSLVYGAISGYTKPGDAENAEIMRKYYTD